MESEPMPSSLAVLQSPKRSPSLLDSLLMLDSDALTSLSAANTPMVATQSGLEELLRLAHGHVDSVVAHFAAEELEAASLDEEGCVIVVTPETKTASFAATVSRIVSGVIRTFRRKARGEAGASLEFVQLNASDVGEARYERLKSGFTRLKHHMESVVEHRELLNCALDQLRAATMTLQDTCSLLTKSSVTPPVDFMANLSESSAAVESVKTVLDQEVSSQTSRKLAELQRFEEQIEMREQLRHQVELAERQLQRMRAHTSTRRIHSRRANLKRVTAMHEIAAKRQEFQRLRRRLDVMTEALEHVFQFHFQLDQCIAEPELETVRNQLHIFFQQNQRSFEAMQPVL